VELPRPLPRPPRPLPRPRTTDLFGVLSELKYKQLILYYKSGSMQNFNFYLLQCCGSEIRDPKSGAFLTPGSGMGKKSATGSGMNHPYHIFWSIETSYPGFRMEKSRIWDKHPGFATLLHCSYLGTNNPYHIF